MGWFGWLLTIIFAFAMCGPFFNFLNREKFNSFCPPPPPKTNCETFCVYFDEYTIPMLILFAIGIVFLILSWISHREQMEQMNVKIYNRDSKIYRLQLTLEDLRYVIL